MESATATPKSNTRKRELHTADMPIKQHDSFTLPDLDQALERDSDVEIMTEKQLMKSRMEALAFNEEPIMIRIEPSSEKNAPKCVDCWVNGKGAEVFDTHDNRWYAYGALPVGKIIITRRKYVEVLARSKRDDVSTEVVGRETERPENKVHRSTSQRAVFTVIDDRNPKGAEWLQRLLYFA